MTTIMVVVVVVAVTVSVMIIKNKPFLSRVGPKPQGDLGTIWICTEHIYPDESGDTIRNQAEYKCH